MKLIANSFRRYILVALSALPLVSAEAENCQCADPPGGEVRCPKGYAAYCIVRDGRSLTGCEEAPKGASDSELQKWIIEKALTKAGLDKSKVTKGNAQFNTTKGTGEVTDTSSGYIITFTLPRQRSIFMDGN